MKFDEQERLEPLDRFDSRYDLSDDPMDQAKMAKLRRMDYDDEPDLYNPLGR